MGDQVRRPEIEEHAQRVLRLIVESTARMENLRPEELDQLEHKLLDMKPRGKGLANINDPVKLYRTFETLCKRGKPTMGEFSQALSVPLSTATRIANFLFDNSYVERLNDPDDRRVVRLSLTEKGRKTREVIEHFLMQVILQMLKFLTPEEQAIGVTLVNKLNSKLSEMG